MNAVLPRPSGSASAMAPHAPRWALWTTLTMVAALAALYHETLASMVAVWAHSETFKHGFVIVPISAALLWRQRDALMHLQAQPCLRALLLLMALGVLWLLATMGDVSVARQYAAVAMIPVSLWAVLGTRLVRRMAFPLAFLLLAVPFGDAFIPALIDITADATVWALQLTGIPVYREGNAFTIPTGTWSVVEACSGIRYLIASIMLGCLYAHLTYRSRLRQTVFIALSAIVPIAANSMRAYLIVMLGHVSDMKLAVGVDHLIYGWIFFGAVMLLLFWIGGRWREDGPVPAVEAALDRSSPAQEAGPPRTQLVLITALACVALALVWPAWARLVQAGAAPAPAAAITFPEHAGPWQRSRSTLPWQPVYTGTPTVIQTAYRDVGREVNLQVAYYPVQAPDSDLVAYGNAALGRDEERWHGMRQRTRNVTAAGLPLTLHQTSLYAARTRILVWRWYTMEGMMLASPYEVKLRLALNRLLGRPTDGAEIVVAAQFQESEAEAATVLQDFLHQMLPTIEQGINHARYP